MVLKMENEIIGKEQRRTSMFKIKNLHVCQYCGSDEIEIFRKGRRLIFHCFRCEVTSDGRNLFNRKGYKRRYQKRTA
jgi:ribosomal protein L37AE/L43A